MKDQIENLIDEIHVKVENAATDPVCTGVNIDLTFEEADLIVRGLVGLKHVTATRANRKEVFGDTEHRSPYQVTVAGMLSPDYKERFKAEYQQTKIRYDKLNAFCNRIEAAIETSHEGKKVEMPAHDCPLELLRSQQGHMGLYLHDLEIRAVIEGIDLA